MTTEAEDSVSRLEELDVQHNTLRMKFPRRLSNCLFYRKCIVIFESVTSFVGKNKYGFCIVMQAYTVAIYVLKFRTKYEICRHNDIQNHIRNLKQKRIIFTILPFQMLKVSLT